VLGPAEMTSSSFAEPIAPDLEPRAVSGITATAPNCRGRWRVVPEHAAAGLWSTPTDIAKFCFKSAAPGAAGAICSSPRIPCARCLSPRTGAPYGLGAAVSGNGGYLVVMKRSQNVGNQGYLIPYPATGQGLVVMTNSDNGSTFAAALISRAVKAYGWPPVPPLAD
jgi:hypothetical protein